MQKHIPSMGATSRSSLITLAMLKSSAPHQEQQKLLSKPFKGGMILRYFVTIITTIRENEKNDELNSSEGSPESTRSRFRQHTFRTLVGLDCIPW